jgi:hypothetical protein
MSYRLRFGAVGAALLLASAAGATTITSYGAYSAAGLSSWESTLTGTATALNFGTVPYAGSSTSYPLAGFIFADPSMTEYENAFLAHSVTVTLPATGETALLLDFANNTSNGHETATSLTFTFPDQETFSESSLGMFGIASMTPFTSVTITANTVSGSAKLLAVDGLWYGPAPQSPPPDPTPEAATVLLTSGGALILLGSGRKLMQRRTA